MKKIKGITIAVTVLLIAVLLFGVGNMFFYYPHYVMQKGSIVVPDNSKKDEIRVMSMNLRTLAPTDFGKKSWFYRADLNKKTIEDNSPDIIGFQEATKVHYKYLCESLFEYDSVIQYRDNSPLSEGCPIFYKTDKYKLIDKGSFWLSETPEKMSKDWGSKCYRICSYVILETKEKPEKFVVFNTHLDHVSDSARINGIKVVLDKVAEFGDYRFMVMGDFNAIEGTETYNNAIQSLLDSKYQAPSFEKSCTYQNFGANLDDECIDYVMTSMKGFKVNSYEVIKTTYDGIYASDHFPLLVSLKLT